MRYFLSFILLINMSTFLWGQKENWVYRYNGPGNSDDRADPIIYAPDGNIYAAGCGYDSDYDITVISLTTSGTENWIYRYNEPGDTFAFANDIIYGDDGNIYVSGISTGEGQNGTGYDFIVISLTSSGTENWVYRLNGAGNDDDRAYSIVYGPDSNLYVAGSITGSGTDNDFTVVSLTTSGVENWTYTYNGPANQYDNAYDIVYGLDGNLYITGYTYGIGTYLDITTISLTPSGTERWVYRYNGLLDNKDRSFSIVYGDDGNIYTAGYAICYGAYDFIVISLDTSGTERWKYIYNGPANSTDRAICIVYGADGNLYASGHSIANATGFDGIVISLTTSGTERWIYRYDRQNYYLGFDECTYITYGADGNIYTAGYSADSLLYQDFTVISLTPSGVENWVYWYNGPGEEHDAARTVIYGSDGNIYAAGFSTGNGTGFDFTVISLNPGVSISEKEKSITDFSYLQCYPDPFSENTVIEFELSKPQRVSLKIFDIKGSLIRVLFDGIKPKGIHKIIWDGRGKAGRKVPSGIYFFQLKTEDGMKARKIIKTF